MGGMMRFGIPKYRLPRDVLDAEMQRVVDLGVEVKLNSKVDNLLETMESGKFDAAFLAVGAHIGKRAFIPAGAVSKIVDAISVLRSMENEEKPMLGRRVIVYGGGNTAIDVARTAKRMGAEPIIVYRRNREKAPAHDFEIEEAMQEGVMIKWLSTIKEAGDANITIEKWNSTTRAFRNRPESLKRWRPIRLCWHSVRMWILACLTVCRVWSWPTVSSPSIPT